MSVGRRRWWTLGILLAASWLSVPARASVVQVEQEVIYMECACCAHFASITARKLPGVERVTASFNRRVLTLRMKAEHPATLAGVQQFLRASHYVLGEATVDLEGLVANDGGRPVLMVDDQLFWLVADGSALRQLQPGAHVRLTGRVAPPPATPAPGEPVVVTVSKVEASHDLM